MKTFRNLALATLGLFALAAAIFPDAAAAAQSFVAFVGPENLAAISMAGITVTKSSTFTGAYPNNVQPRDAGVYEMPIPFDLPAANPVANDLLALVKIPAGIQVIDWMITAGDADSNGAPTLEFTLGTLKTDLTDLNTTWKTGVVVAKDGSMLRCADNVAFLESTAAERWVGIKFTTTAATYVAGKKGLLVLRLTA